MDISQIETRLKYITNAAGDKTEVIVPVEIWNAVINLLPPTETATSPLATVAVIESFINSCHLSWSRFF